METPVVEALPAVPLSREPFSVGAVLSRTFSVWSANLPVFAGSTAVLLLPALLLPEMRPDAPSTLIWTIIYGLYVGLVSLVISGAFIFGVVQQLRGKKVTPGELVAAGTRNMLPLIGTGIVTGLMILGGYLLLIVPGILFTLRWMLVSPVVVMEAGANPRKRSSVLTEGHRGALFGMIILVAVVGAVLGAVMGRHPRQRFAGGAPGATGVQHRAHLVVPGGALRLRLLRAARREGGRGRRAARRGVRLVPRVRSLSPMWLNTGQTTSVEAPRSGAPANAGARRTAAPFGGCEPCIGFVVVVGHPVRGVACAAYAEWCGGAAGSSRVGAAPQGRLFF